MQYNLCIVVLSRVLKTSTGYSDFFICPDCLTQGCKLSPILVVMFFNELSVKLQNNNTRGVQIYPDTTYFLMLMFAGDIALIQCI